MATPNINNYLGQVPLRSPQNSAQFDQLISQLQNAQPNFQNTAEKARKNLATQTIPGIAERFSASMGQSRNSGGLQAALGRAGSDLETNLKALEDQFGQGQQNLLAQLLSGQDVENVFQPRDKGFLNAAAPAVGLGLGATAGAYAPSVLSSLGSWLSGIGGTAAKTATTAAPYIGHALGGAGGSAAATTAASSAAPLLAGASASFPPLLALLAALGTGYGAYNYLND